jgi:manganese-dependent inorganic pyrophosphatase
MQEIYVIGHKNPDTDSACAAYCYAQLKNSIDPDNRYIPAVCGALQTQAKFVFSHAGVTPPQYIKDIRPRVIDVARNDGMRLDINDPIFLAMKELDEHTISVIPVFSEVTRFKGIIGIHEVSSFFIAGGMNERPSYTFRAENIAQVVPGHFYKKGSDEEFTSYIMIGAMTYESTVRRINDLLPAKPVLVIGQRSKIINYAIEHDFPAIILTGIAEDSQIEIDFSKYKGFVYVSSRDTAETIRLLRLSVSVRHIMNAQPLVLQHDGLFDDAKTALLTSEHRGLPVLQNNSFAGVVTRRSFIEKPKKKLILVDHNELTQGIPGSEDSEICEIIDHHRFAPERTSKPIYVYAKPVGSTCTIIFSHYIMSNIPIPPDTALLLLAGILSDTLILKSPTTTKEDIEAAAALAEIAGTEVAEYGALLLAQMAVLKNADPFQVTTADLKIYTESGTSAGIGQVEVGTLNDIADAKEGLLAALNRVKQERSLAWAMVLITDVVKEHSVLLVTDYAKGEKELLYKKLESNLYDLPGILSRKKQLLPEILRVLETAR